MGSKLRALILALAALWAASLPSPVAAQRARTASALNELASLQYQSDATQAAGARFMDDQLLALRRGIANGEEALRAARSQRDAARAQGTRAVRQIAQLEARIGSLETAAANDKFAFTAALAARDADYARELARLRTVGENLLSTPEGAAALARYNQGGPGSYEAAARVLGELEAERERVRRKLAELQAQQDREQRISDRRGRAQLALDAFAKGRTSAAEVIALLERVIELAPDSGADLWTVAIIYSQTDLSKSLAYMDRALRNPSEGKPQFERLIAACVNVSRVAEVQRAERYCKAAEQVAVEASTGKTDGLLWKHRTFVARLSLANLYYSWDDSARGDAIFDALYKPLGEALPRDPFETSTFMQILSALVEVGEHRYGDKLDDPQSVRKFLAFTESISALWTRVPAERVDNIFARLMETTIMQARARARFYSSKDVKHIADYAELGRRWAAESGSAESLVRSGVAYTFEFEQCRMYRVAGDFATGVETCLRASDAIRKMQGQAGHPAERFKLDMDLSLSEFERGKIEVARGRKAAAGQAFRSAFLASEAALSYVQRSVAKAEPWEDNHLAIARELFATFDPAAEEAETISLLRRALPLAISAARQETRRVAQRAYAEIAYLLASRGDPAVSWRDVATQFRRLEQLGFLMPGDRKAYDVARSRSGMTSAGDARE